jgi:signal transduction histidine kinase
MIPGGLALCYRPAMVISRWRIERLASVIGLFAIAIGVLTPLVARNGPGVGLGVDSGRVVVWWVDPYGPAAQYGVEAGMVVIDVNGRELIGLPEAIYPEQEPTPDPITGEQPVAVPIIEPAVPTPVSIGQDELDALVAQPVTDLFAMRPSDLASYSAENPRGGASIGDDGTNSLRASMVLVVFGIGVLFATAWWLTTGRAGESLRDLGLPLAVATAAPFLVQPLTHVWAPLAGLVLAVLLPLAMLPLTAILVDRIEAGRDRELALVAAATCGVVAVVLGIADALSTGAGDVKFATTALVDGMVVIPGVIAAGPVIPGAHPTAATPGAEATASGRLLTSTELAVAGLTPALALATASSSLLIVFLLWVVAIMLAGRFTVRPLARLASRAALQRDLIVAATEAERARVAADIHDDALQELTMLVHRLDAAGDAEGAEVARGVSDRLRAICGDLRLPILDDLGVGPALDWLVLRIERLAGGEVRLERTDGTRPPSVVELAFFRVAQEALANAVKHGRPPIVVHYRATPDGAMLAVDDAGPGIGADAGDRAEREGHFGLLNMQQRAEGIGAILDVRRWPAGGTHVQLDWRPR